MTTSSDEGFVAGDYEDGDVNTVDADDRTEPAYVEDAYEEGDVNATSDLAGADVDEDEDVDDAFGNLSEGGTPNAVLTYLARSLANEPEAVVIHTEEHHGGVRFRLHVAPDDMGRVIGRRGRTAQAIRTLVGVAGARDGVQTSVDIVDD